jgi:hypothetical protein
MALSPATIADLEAARQALDDYYEKRLGEIDREVRNLQERRAPVSSLGEKTTAAGTAEALDILTRIGIPVS